MNSSLRQPPSKGNTPLNTDKIEEQNVLPIFLQIKWLSPEMNSRPRSINKTVSELCNQRLQWNCFQPFPEQVVFGRYFNNSGYSSDVTDRLFPMECNEINYFPRNDFKPFESRLWMIFTVTLIWRWMTYIFSFIFSCWLLFGSEKQFLSTAKIASLGWPPKFTWFLRNNWPCLQLSAQSVSTSDFWIWYVDALTRFFGCGGERAACCVIWPTLKVFCHLSHDFKDLADTVQIQRHNLNALIGACRKFLLGGITEEVRKASFYQSCFFVPTT